jgi:hypothetical protein
MRRTLAGLVTGVLIVLTAGSAGAAPAATQWLSIDVNPEYHQVNSVLQVADTATIKQKGMAVDWQVRFQCPKGEKYTLSGASLGNLNPPNPPQLQDGDYSIRAGLRQDVTGTCTGKWQVKTLHLYTVETTWRDIEWQGVFYPAGSCWCPLEPDESAETNLHLYGNGFSALYASNVGAYYTAENKVVLVGGKS